MAHDAPHFENVCMSGTYIVGAMFLGLAITAVIFSHAFFMH